MPLSQVIAPKPTRYKGVLYRSRLEASWAVYWDALGIKFEYETWGPDRELAGGLDPSEIFDYTPDFLVQINSTYQIFQEVKPIVPNSDYRLFLQRVGAAIAPSSGVLLLTIGGFRDRIPPRVLHFPYVAAYMLESIMWKEFWSPKEIEKAMEIAANMRWDLYTDDTGKTRKRKPK